MIKISDTLSIDENKTSKQIYDQLRVIRVNSIEYHNSGIYGGVRLPAFIELRYEDKPFRLYFDKDGEKGQLIKVMTRERPDSMRGIEDKTLYKRHWWN